MRQFEHEGKQIQLLPLRLTTGQPQKISTLALLPTPPSPPLIVIVPSISPTNHAYYVSKSLPPLPPTPSHYKASSLHLHLYHINTCTNYTKRSVIKINGVM